jgi:hypothetical protein
MHTRRWISIAGALLWTLPGSLAAERIRDAAALTAMSTAAPQDAAASGHGRQAATVPAPDLAARHPGSPPLAPAARAARCGPFTATSQAGCLRLGCCYREVNGFFLGCRDC